MSSRRHKLSSEASRRFEREVDPLLPRYAAQRVADLLADLAGGTIQPDETVIDTHPLPEPVTIRADHAARVAGAPISIEETSGTSNRSGARSSRPQPTRSPRRSQLVRTLRLWLSLERPRHWLGMIC